MRASNLKNEVGCFYYFIHGILNIKVEIGDIRKMSAIENYLNQFEGTKREWLEQLILFMREETQLEESLDYKMPTYKGRDFYIAFAPQKNYFSFYTDEVSVLEIFKAEMPRTALGKGCAKIKYTESDAVNVIIPIIKEIIVMHRDTRRDTVSDLSAVKKWKDIPEHVRTILASNVFCSKCGVTTIAEGYSIQDNKPYGIILRGKCKKCDEQVARCIESD